jgi:hypothetical protein
LITFALVSPQLPQSPIFFQPQKTTTQSFSSEANSTTLPEQPSKQGVTQSPSSVSLQPGKLADLNLFHTLVGV